MDGYARQHEYIACQGPTDRTIVDMWRMLWQKEVVVIVSLTKLGGNKCALYFPPVEFGKCNYGKITVENRGVQHRDSYEATSLRVSRGNVSRRCLHMCYYTWPDKGTPDSSSKLLRVIEMMRYNQNALVRDGEKLRYLTAGRVHPIVVHCSAGVGRTGTLLALDICMREIVDTAAKGQAHVSLLDTVLKLRRQRPFMVQRLEQYVFLHMAMLDFALRKEIIDPSTIKLAQFYANVKAKLRDDDEEN